MDAPFDGERNDRRRLLRCVIAKRFSNETILWYMSKEVEDEVTHEIRQTFSFWSKATPVPTFANTPRRRAYCPAMVSRRGSP